MFGFDFPVIDAKSAKAKAKKAREKRNREILQDLFKHIDDAAGRGESVYYLCNWEEEEILRDNIDLFESLGYKVKKEKINYFNDSDVIMKIYW